MGAWGGIIMGFFGAVFAALTLSGPAGVAGPAVFAPFIVSAVIGLAAARALRLPGPGIAPSAAASRVIMWSSIAEGVGLFIAANLVTNLHHPEYLLPAMALVVGLHFLPMGWAAAFAPFYLLGGALVLASAAGFVLTSPLGAELSGGAAALSLWLAASLAVAREQNARRGAGKSDHDHAGPVTVTGSSSNED